MNSINVSVFDSHWHVPVLHTVCVLHNVKTVRIILHDKKISCMHVCRCAHVCTHVHMHITRYLGYHVEQYTYVHAVNS